MSSPSEAVISTGKQRPSSSNEIQATTKPKPEIKESGVKYIYSPQGLFPVPLGRNAKAAVVTKAKSKFKLLGKFMAKALMDSRMVDFY